METIVLTLIMGFFLALFILIPRLFKSDVSKSVQTNNIIKAPKAYTKAEVSLHDKRTDCWIIIKQKIYDVTSYVEEHPGGDAILAHAGDDSTEGFYGWAKRRNKKNSPNLSISSETTIGGKGGGCPPSPYGGSTPEFWPQHATRVFDMIEDFYVGDLQK